MTWIQTFTGRPVEPAHMVEDDIRIEDIAHSLSLQCRFKGHCTEFYSVADHSLRCSRATDDPTLALHLLLHDAHEAYLGDISGPLKGLFTFNGRPVGAALEYSQRMVYQALYITWPEPEMWESVSHIDCRMLATERRDLMAPCHRRWVNLLEPYEDEIVPERNWRTVQSDFIDRYNELWEIYDAEDRWT